MLGGLTFTLLPLLAVWCVARTPQEGWRVALLRAALMWAAGILIVTELLSLAGALRWAPILMCYVLAHVVVGVGAWRGWRARSIPQVPRPPLPWALGIGLLATLALVTAIVAPPNTPDVLSYHLPRQLMWLQQGSLAHFITADDRALLMPPLVEIIQAHALLLSGGDHWANLTQWTAYVLGSIVCSLLVRELGGRMPAQLLGGALFATLPMAYLEASSAKNDVLVAVWLGIFSWHALRLAGGTESRLEWSSAGVAFGLALATKPTAILFGAPVALLLVRRSRRQPKGAALLLGATLLLPAPHAFRNYAWYGTPLGVHHGDDGGAQANALVTPAAVASNLLRNATLHLATPSERVNHEIERAVAKVHGALGLDASDRRTTLWVLNYGVIWAPDHETTAGAPVHGLLGVVALGWLIARGPHPGAARRLALVLLLGVLFFAMALKWQPWGARLHLPGFLLLAALTALVVESWGRRWVTAAGALALFAWLPSAEPENRPLWTSPSLFAWTRWQNYFRANPLEVQRVDATLQRLAETNVGSLQVISKHGFSYPMLKRLLADGDSRTRIWGERADLERGPPDAVLFLERFPRMTPLYFPVPNAKERYRICTTNDRHVLYVAESRVRPLPNGTWPLPPFVGWSESQGLGSMEGVVRDHQPATIRQMTHSTVALNLNPVTPQMTLRLKLENRASTACDLEVRLDGRRVGSLTLPPQQVTESGLITLQPAGATARLEIIASREAPALTFLALQINDR